MVSTIKCKSGASVSLSKLWINVSGRVKCKYMSNVSVSKVSIRSVPVGIYCKVSVSVKLSVSMYEKWVLCGCQSE